MKKILTLLFVSILLFCLPANVFAEGETTEVSGSQGTVELYANIASAYSVLLPKKVDVRNDSTDFYVFAKGSITFDKKLDVASDDSSQHVLEDQSAGSDRSYDLQISISNGSFSAERLGSTYQDDLKATFTITHDALPAGNYSYHLPILISLNSVS